MSGGVDVYQIRQQYIASNSTRKIDNVVIVSEPKQSIHI